MTALDHSPEQYDLVDYASGYRQYELEQAISDAVSALREQRANHASPNGGPALESEREAQRRIFNSVLKPYGWRVSAIPARKEVGYDRI